MKNKLRIISLLLIALVLSACSQQLTNYGYISIQLPTTNNARAAYDIEKLQFDILLTNQKTEKEEIFRGDGRNDVTIIEIPAGTYNLTLEAYIKDTEKLIYTGTVFDVVVNANEETQVEIKLNRIKFEISFDANGGKEEMDKVIFKNGDEAVKLPECKFTAPEGHHFDHWATTKEETDSTKKYNEGDSYTPEASVTFFAIWAKNKVTAMFDANGGTGTIEPITAEFGDNIELPSYTATPKENYHFVGWATTKDSPTLIYKEKAVFELKENVTFYAVWKEDTVESGAGLNYVIYETTEITIKNYNDDSFTGFIVSTNKKFENFYLMIFYDDKFVDYKTFVENINDESFDSTFTPSEDKHSCLLKITGWLGKDVTLAFIYSYYDEFNILQYDELSINTAL